MTAKWQYKEAFESVVTRMRPLKKENERLRELVKDLCNCMRGCCDDLGGCHVFRGERGWCFVSKELKELGIEVPND